MAFAEFIDSKYLTRDIFLYTAVKKKFPLLSVVWYLFNVVSSNRPGAVMEIHLVLLLLFVTYVLPDHLADGYIMLTTFGNQTNCGLCHDSLNWLNLVSESHLEKTLLNGNRMGKATTLVLVSGFGYQFFVMRHLFFVMRPPLPPNMLCNAPVHYTKK